jgi:hypothetical protein
MMRQITGPFAEHEKAKTMAKLKVARERKRLTTGKCEGRKSHAEINPEMVQIAKGYAGASAAIPCGPSLPIWQSAAMSTPMARSSQRHRWPQC